nr:CHASE sensor domain-containing protein [Thiorhodococcus mannitoliphagus]
MDLKLFQDHVLRDLRVLAAVIGDSCVSTLVFDSPETAERYLATLAREYQIQEAILEDADGLPFARWSRDRAAEPDAAPAPSPTEPPPPWLGAYQVEIAQPLSFDGHPIGRLVLRAQLDELQHQLRQYALFGGLLALLTLGVAFVAALRLQRRIAHPILNLAAKTREITAQRNVTLRVAEIDSGDEIATLVHDFNLMLGRIEEREEALRRHAEALSEANAKLRRLAMDLSLLEAAEKQRLAGQLHDSPMQKLALAQLQIAAGAKAGGADEESCQQLAAGLALMREAIGELRSLQFELSPPILYQKGLAAALDWLASNTEERWGIRMICTIDSPQPDPGRDASVILFQCARELVYNLIKHSGASQGAIRLMADREGFAISVEDNGCGLADDAPAIPAQDRSGYGLYSVRERLGLLGGTLELMPMDPGTRARIGLPRGAFADDTARAAEGQQHRSQEFERCQQIKRQG